MKEGNLLKLRKLDTGSVLAESTDLGRNLINLHHRFSTQKLHQISWFTKQYGEHEGINSNAIIIYLS